ncbi:diacylglycerol kinase family protein [Eggerthellaceae bacterium 24-137]
MPADREQRAADPGADRNATGGTGRTDSRKRPDRFVRRAADSRACGEGRFSLACAFRCAARGIGYAFTSQRNLKIQLIMAIVAVAAGFALGISREDWLAIVLAIMVVAVAEVVNTAVESVVDLASPRWHELARAAKDAGAGAVLIASAGSVAVGLIVFLPRLASLLAG